MTFKKIEKEIVFTNEGWVYKLKNNYYKRSCAVWIKKYIQPFEKVKNFENLEKISKEVTEDEISNWFKLNTPKGVIDYLNDFNLYFVNDDTALRDLREYSIASLKISNNLKEMKITFKTRDTQLLILLVEERSVSLAFWGVKIEKIFTNKGEIPINSISILEFFSLIIEQKTERVTLLMSDLSHCSIITWPVLDGYDDPEIIKFL